MCIRIRPKYAPFFIPYSKSYTNHVGPKEVEGFNCCMFCWPSPVLGPSTNGTKREKPMEKPNGASTIRNQHAPPESQWFQGRQFRVALCIYRITCTCCGYIYIYGWWDGGTSQSIKWESVWSNQHFMEWHHDICRLKKALFQQKSPPGTPQHFRHSSLAVLQLWRESQHPEVRNLRNSVPNLDVPFWANLTNLTLDFWAKLKHNWHKFQRYSAGNPYNLPYYSDSKIH